MRVAAGGRIVALGWASRLLGLFVSLAMVRIALRILGENQFAVFQILITALAWLSLSSLGLGPTLKNLVSEHRARGENDGPLREASATLVAILFVIGAALLWVAAPGVSFGLLRKLSHDQVWAYRAFVAGGVLSLLAALGQIGTEIMYAEFRAARVYLLSIVSSALTLASLVLLGRLARPASELVFWVVCATIGPQALTGVAGLGMTRLLRVRLTRPPRPMLFRISRLAFRFWGFALLSNLILLVDYLVISQILVAREIVLYSVMMKVVTVGVVLFTTVIAVAWPEWTHDWELRRFAVLRHRVLLLATIGAGVCVPGAVLAVYALPMVFRIWLHNANVIPSAMLVVVFIAYLAVRLWTDVHSSALMAGNRVGSATKFAFVQALITAPLEFFLGRVWGAEGVIFGLLLGFLSTTAWLFPWRFYGELGRLSAAETIAADDRGVA